MCISELVLKKSCLENRLSKLRTDLIALELSVRDGAHISDNALEVILHSFKELLKEYNEVGTKLEVEAWRVRLQMCGSEDVDADLAKVYDEETDSPIQVIPSSI